MATRKWTTYLFDVLVVFSLALGIGPVNRALAATTSTGRHELANRDYTSGWACDADNYNLPVVIYFYIEGGIFVGSAVADQYHGNLVSAGVCGGNGYHGFTFSLPSSLKDGRTRTIYAYALDINSSGELTGGPNSLLRGSPISVFLPAPPAETYFSQPYISASQVDTTIIGEINPPAWNQFFIRMGAMGAQADSATVTWNVGQYTGLAANSAYQRGPNNNTGATAVQALDNVVGIWINSASVPYSGDLIPITPAYWWLPSTGPRPWVIPGSELSFSFELQVPYAARQGAGEVYVDGYFLFQDSAGNSLWYGAHIFDLRPPFPEAYFALDLGTGIPILSTPLGASIFSSYFYGPSYIHLGPGSNAFQQSAWTGYRYFDFRISRIEFEDALYRVRASYPNYSNDPASYRITHINFNPEVAPRGETGENGSGQIGMSVRYIQVARYQTPDVTVYDRVYIRGLNGASDPNLQVYFKTSTSDYYSEDKSVLVAFPIWTGWNEIVADMSQNPNWHGTITGIRIDPFNTNGTFGIDYVYVGDANRNYVKRWEFNGASTITNPFFGWYLSGIGGYLWTNGNQWGGRGVNDNPFFYTDTNFNSGK